ncbi:GTPase [Streptomyces sp. NRRL F-5630]|uniref:YfjP family GTPase n=1 Tax=Streptomyces sp. NRRL F-5630 TaxID=1463864 RepID=UPI003EC1292F
MSTAATEHQDHPGSAPGTLGVTGGCAPVPEPPAPQAPPADDAHEVPGPQGTPGVRGTVGGTSGALPGDAATAGAARVPAPADGTTPRTGPLQGRATARATGSMAEAPHAAETEEDGTDSEARNGSGAAETGRDPRTPAEDNTPTQHEGGTDAGAGARRPAFDDGLIARRAGPGGACPDLTTHEATASRGSGAEVRAFREGPLRERLDALRELVGLSRARLDEDTLAEAGRVLDEAAARGRLSGRHTVVALAGATGSGKSTLFNTLAGANISDTGVRRPTTSAPLACSWTDGAAGLLDRIGVPGRLRRRPVLPPEGDGELSGLVLVDLPDHDSAAAEHRAQVDRVLGLVDAVIWVVDPEKYADAVLHERYLRPLAGHAEVTFVVLNQVDRLPAEAADLVLDDLRRLLDEDGMPLGEHGEPGATVLALSALSGEGVDELREMLAEFVGERRAAARRLSADIDFVAERLRPLYAAGRTPGLSEEARAAFADRLAEAVGATAAGEAAERAWRRNANRACGTPWLRLWRRYEERRAAEQPRPAPEPPREPEPVARQRVEQAVRTVGEEAARGLPEPWGVAVRETAVRGTKDLPRALDTLAERAARPVARPPRPGWWPVAVATQVLMTALQVIGALWLFAQVTGVLTPEVTIAALLTGTGIVGGPAVEWACRMAARGPARRYGAEAERALREAAAGCGRARVLDPVAAELLRYEEVREQYARMAGPGPAIGTGARAVPESVLHGAATV